MDSAPNPVGEERWLTDYELYKDYHKGPVLRQLMILRPRPQQQLEVAQLLLRSGADKDACDNQGYSALAFAASFNHIEVRAPPASPPASSSRAASRAARRRRRSRPSRALVPSLPLGRCSRCSSRRRRIRTCRTSSASRRSFTRLRAATRRRWT